MSQVKIQETNTMQGEIEEPKVHELAKQESKSLSGTSQASTLMSIIERISEMPELDIDRVERLFEMHERMISRQAETDYNYALAQAQREMQSVVANKKNDHTKSSYANLEAVHQTCKPIWTSHGFSVSTTLKSSAVQNHVLVSCEVRHSGGFKRVYDNDWPLDLAGAKGNANKTAIQAMGSTASYARRYTELMIFDIAIKHEDNDGNRTRDAGVRGLTNAQIKTLRDAMAVAGVDDAYICQKAQVARIEELQQQRLQGCLNHLKSIAQKDMQQ